MAPSTLVPSARTSDSRSLSRPSSQPDASVTEQAAISSQSAENNDNEQGQLESRPVDLNATLMSTKRQSSRSNSKRKAPSDAAPSQKRVPHDIRSAGPGRSTDARSKPKLSACHHCRRSTTHCKMACTNVKPDGVHCNKKYCTVCIGKRYPNITFESNCRTFVCPACLNTCNCSFCTRKRGEVYYGERTGVLTPSPAVAKAKEKRSITVLPTDPNLDANAKTYWATVYGVTGEKVATAFVGDDGDDKVIFARPITTSESVVCAQDMQGSSADPILSEASTTAEDEAKA